MAMVVAMYKAPADAAAFNRYYFEKHVPVARRIPGLRSYETTVGPIRSLGAPSPYHLIAVLGFDSLAAIDAALATPEGQATAADIGNFAQAGVDIYYADSANV